MFDSSGAVMFEPMTSTPEIKRSSQRLMQFLDVLRALVLLQGAMLLLVALEAIVMVAFAGPAIAGIFLLSTGATVLTFLTVRGLRKLRRWARRVTIVSEWGLIVFATLDLLLTFALVGSPPPLIPLMVGFVIPIAALSLLRITKPLFIEQGSGDSDVEVPPGEPIPADRPILDVLT